MRRRISLSSTKNWQTAQGYSSLSLMRFIEYQECRATKPNKSGLLDYPSHAPRGFVEGTKSLSLMDMLWHTCQPWILLNPCAVGHSGDLSVANDITIHYCLGVTPQLINQGLLVRGWHYSLLNRYPYRGLDLSLFTTQENLRWKPTDRTHMM